MKMGSSKRKSSFRIDDILHHQRVEQNRLYQHGSRHSSSDAPASGQSVLPEPSGSSAVLAGAHYGSLPGQTMPADLSPVGARSRSSPSPRPAAMAQHSPLSLGPSPSAAHGPSRAESPKKPTAMYPGLLDFSKNVIPIPLQFGVPTFSPLNAAYLEHYASVLHKASPRVWPFYPHPYSYLLPGCGSKRKGGQVRFTPQQTQSLEKRFSNHKYLSPEDRRNLAIQLKLSDRQVKTWFQNRRAKWRRANNGCQSSEGLGSPGSPGDPAKPATDAGTTAPAASTRAHKYSFEGGHDGDDLSSVPRPSGYSPRRSSLDYDCKSSDNYSEHDDGSSEEHDENDERHVDEEPTSPINVV
uniref:Uncharacterized protein n=1 Tax=Anopheles atroparvus TaxID=41427 RepID=A0A182IVH2_ANOAO